MIQINASQVITEQNGGQFSHTNVSAKQSREYSIMKKTREYNGFRVLKRKPRFTQND